MWCIPEMDEEYRRRMYDILDLYQEPYDPRRPVIGLDERVEAAPRGEEKAQFP